MMRITDAELESFPVHHGFRLRGTDMTRSETFTDAAFAFAVTLLVVSLEVPTAFEDLRRAMWGVPAFAASFAILMQFWAGHRRFSRRFGLEDSRTILLSCILVFVILVYVFPLKFLMSGFQIWATRMITGQVPPGGVTINSIDQLRELFIIYGIGFIIVSVLLAMMSHHALKRGEDLRLNELERFDTRADIESWLLLAGVAAVSTLWAVFLPITRFALPGMAYALLGIVMPWHGVRYGKARAARFGESASA